MESDGLVAYEEDRTKQGSREPPKRLEGQEEVVDEEGKPIKWWWNYGWIKVLSINNTSNNKLTFYNPYEDEEKTIESGHSENNYCVGYLPYYDKGGRKYEITYYNEALKQSKKLEMKDLGGQWLMSVYQDAYDEDVCEVMPNPAAFKDYSSIGFNITNTGYEIYSYTWDDIHTSMSWDRRFGLHSS